MSTLSVTRKPAARNRNTHEVEVFAQAVMLERMREKVTEFFAKGQTAS